MIERQIEKDTLRKHSTKMDFTSSPHGKRAFAIAIFDVSFRYQFLNSPNCYRRHLNNNVFSIRMYIFFSCVARVPFSPLLVFPSSSSSKTHTLSLYNGMFLLVVFCLLLLHVDC